VYVEVFGGAASLLFAKTRSQLEVYNDINSDLVNFFRVLRDDKKFEKFYKLLSMTLYSREEFDYAKENFYKESDIVKRAHLFYIGIRAGFGAVSRLSDSKKFSTGWSYSLNKNACVDAWFSNVKDLPIIRKRFLKVQIEHLDFLELIKLYDSKDTFFYCDPPYMTVARYVYNMNREDHVRFLYLIRNIKGRAMISGYLSRFYVDILEKKFGWKRFDFSVIVRATAKVSVPAVECLWVCPKTIRSLGLNKFIKS